MAPESTADSGGICGGKAPDGFAVVLRSVNGSTIPVTTPDCLSIFRTMATDGTFLGDGFLGIQETIAN